MLFKELKSEDVGEINVAPIHPKEDKESVISNAPASTINALPSLPVPSNIVEWTQAQVQQWLVEHNLVQISRLLVDCDGRTLVYLNKYMKSGESKQILSLIQEDSFRRTNQNVSLIDISRFQSLMDQQIQLFRSTATNGNAAKKDY
jgi:hypothetical protein